MVGSYKAQCCSSTSRGRRDIGRLKQKQGPAELEPGHQGVKMSISCNRFINIYDNNVDIDEENIDVKTPFGRLLSSVSVGSSTESLKLLLNFIVLMFRAAMITCKKFNISDIFCWQNE